MSRKTFTAFQKHLIYFSTPTSPPRLTFLSSLRAACSLGLDFPVSVLLSLSLRILYAPWPYFWSTINIEKIPQSSHRTQLSNARIQKNEHSCLELLDLLKSEPKKAFLSSIIDQGHVVGFWAMAADTNTHKVSKADVERFQHGEWEEAVAKRRRSRENTLPLWRGGPIWAGGHSWAVKRLLGVRVYENKD